MAYIGNKKDLEKLEDWHIYDGTGGTPNLQGRFLEGVTSINDVKILHDAGLPNITAIFPSEVPKYNASAYIFSGAAQQNAITSYGGWGTAWNDQGLNTYKIDFDAKRCSSIYGNSSTVQPESFTVIYIMKVN